MDDEHFERMAAKIENLEATLQELKAQVEGGVHFTEQVRKALRAAVDTRLAEILRQARPATR